MTENERVHAARKALGLTMEKFGAKIGITSSAVGNIEKGRRGLTEQMCRSICREFGVSETWLRTGEGQMMDAKPRDTALAEKLDEILTVGPDDFRRRLISVLVNLPPEKWDVLEEIAVSVRETVPASAQEVPTAPVHGEPVDKTETPQQKWMREVAEETPEDVPYRTEEEIQAKLAAYEALLRGEQRLRKRYATERLLLGNDSETWTDPNETGGNASSGSAG